MKLIFLFLAVALGFSAISHALSIIRSTGNHVSLGMRNHSELQASMNAGELLKRHRKTSQGKKAPTKKNKKSGKKTKAKEIPLAHSRVSGVNRTVPSSSKKTKSSDKFCQMFTSECYDIALNGKIGRVEVVHACRRHGNKDSSSYTFGCKANGQDMTEAVLSKTGHSATTTRGSIIVATVSTIVDKTSTLFTTATTTASLTQTELSPTTTTVHSETVSTKTEQATSTSTSSALTETTTTTSPAVPTTTITTSTATSTLISTSETTTVITNTVTTTGTLTATVTTPTTLTTSTTSTSTVYEYAYGVPVTVVVISGTPERRAFLETSDSLPRRALSPAPASVDATPFCGAFTQGCDEQCARVGSSSKYKICHKENVVSQTEQYRLACVCSNRKVETQHALRAAAEDQRVSTLATLYTSTATVTAYSTSLVPVTQTTTLTRTFTTTSVGVAALTQVSTSVATATHTSLTNTVLTSTKISTKTNATPTVVATSTTVTTETPSSTTTETSSVSTTATAAASTTTTMTEASIAGTVTNTVTSTTNIVAAPTGYLAISANGGPSGYVGVRSDYGDVQLTHIVTDQSTAIAFMAVLDETSGLFQLQRMDSGYALVAAVGNSGDALKAGSPAYINYQTESADNCGATLSTMAAAYTADPDEANYGNGCEVFAFDLENLRDQSSTRAYPVWWNSGDTAPQYIVPFYDQNEDFLGASSDIAAFEAAYSQTALQTEFSFPA